MKVDKFDDYLNENLAEAFGSIVTTYNKKVRSGVIDVVCDVNHISEKDFRRYDIIKDRVEQAFMYNPEMDDAIRKFENLKSRVQYCAEHIYQWFIKGTEIEKEI